MDKNALLSDTPPSAVPVEPSLSPSRPAASPPLPDGAQPAFSSPSPSPSSSLSPPSPPPPSSERSTVKAVDEVDEAVVAVAVLSISPKEEEKEKEKEKGAVRRRVEDLPIDSSTRSCIVYDPLFTRHECNYAHPEQPARVSVTWSLLQSSGLVDGEREREEGGRERRCLWIQPRSATTEELLYTHTAEHVALIDSTALLTYKEEEVDSEDENEATRGLLFPDCVELDGDTFANAHSSAAARLCCGGLIDLLQLTYQRRIKNGFALIRPPGHHSFSHKPGGFCLYNNVAVAVNALRKEHPQMKCAIVDWDVHHGDGTQALFYNTDKVLYMSTHRHDFGHFYPCTGGAGEVGAGLGLGYNVNFPLNFPGMGDKQYMQAFEEVFVPILKQYKPDILVVSAGFDACVGDPLGGMEITPECYGQLLQKLTRLELNKDNASLSSDTAAETLLAHSEQKYVPVVVALEGGYNVKNISHAISSCVRVLLNESPYLDGQKQMDLYGDNAAAKSSDANVSSRAEIQFKEDLDVVIKAQSHYWSGLEKPDKIVPKTPEPPQTPVRTSASISSARHSMATRSQTSTPQTAPSATKAARVLNL